ncbi:MAG: hypothetical protein JO090_16735 [Rhizobacter sp.]|nr:hypothetical protein [Rhizobacter sp.]
MAFGSLRSTLRRRWSWLLSLGLLFAFAQAAANSHAISHGVGSRDGALIHAQCDLCLMGAAIGSAAPLPEPPSARHPPLGDVAIVVAAVAVRDVACALAYRSRAPPALQR